MTEGKVAVEFKTAKGSVIEVSEEELKQSQQWFEKIMAETGTYDNVSADDTDNDASFGSIEDDDSQDVKEDYKDEKYYRQNVGSSSSPLPNITPQSFPYLPSTPIPFNINSPAFKPFKPPTMSNELRQEMVARRSMDRKRKAPDDSSVPSTPVSTISPITPEQRERIRRNREAALAKRKSLQGK